MTFEQVKELFQISLPSLSVLAGVLLTWILTNRSKNRDFIANEIMQKKINAYEGLYGLMQVVQTKLQNAFEQAVQAEDRIRNDQLNDESFAEALNLMKFCDDNKLYLDEDLVIHIGAMCMIAASLKDVDISDKDYKTNIKKLAIKFNQDFNVGVELLKDYMGIKRLEKSFKKINKSTTKSEFIDYVNKLKKDYKR